MRSDDIARLLVEGMRAPSASGDIGFHTGVIESWDELTGVNTVTVNGTSIPNLKAIQSGIGLLYHPGDVVAVFRYQTSYFVWGKIAAPGAGAANQIRSTRITDQVSLGASAFDDLPGSFGPRLSDVYIGSSRRCLVMVSATIATNQSLGAVGVDVSGASSISPDIYKAGAVTTVGTSTVAAASAAQVLLTEADGLNEGFNTFTSKYHVQLFGSGTSAFFSGRALTVIPF